MSDNAESALPDSIRDHPLLSQLRSSLQAEAAAREGPDSSGWDPVASALALSGMLPEPPAISG